MDKIILKGMKIFGYHGVYEEEKKLGQKFIVDLEMFLDLKEAGKHDDFTKTVNYVEVYNNIENIVKNFKFHLLETLAEKIAEEVLSNTLIKNVKVRIRKPAPPVDAEFEYIGVEIER